jgi:hypothetical protein
MKKILILSFISASTFFFFSCDKPAPTQLVDDTQNELEVELLNNNFDSQNLISGADTSGITQDLTSITNLVSVSGIKITNKDNKTTRLSLAQAMFFNKSEPIRYADNRIIAYKTLVPGTIKFNGLDAHVVPYRIKFRDLGILKDTLLGYKYVLYNVSDYGGSPDPFYYSYNASVSFEFNPFGPGNGFAFNISTPLEITGQVILSGKRAENNLEAKLKWNQENSGRISIVIGLIKPNQINSIPVYRLKTQDDGELRIPERYFNQLPLERFEKIVFTFIRSFEVHHGFGNNDLIASSQSIHTIVIDIP